MSLYLSGRTQSVRVDGASSRAETMQYEVPQGSVLGPSCFCYLPPIWTQSSLTTGLCCTYADDSELYLYCRPDQIQQLQIITIECIMDIDSWMKSNRLRLNRAKTEFLWLATPRRLHYFNDSPFIFGQNHRQAHHHCKKSRCDDESRLLNEVPHE